MGLLNKRRKNIALYGGKFDPPHLGHLNVARTALKAAPYLDELWFIPTKTHPWREIFSSGENRVNMLKLFRNKKFRVLDLELRRDRPSITIDTIRELKKSYPEYNFFWLCGADTIERFNEWDEHEELIRLMTFLVYPRPGIRIDQYPEGFRPLSDRPIKEKKFSSTTVRERVRLGLPIERFVGKAVAEYIGEKGLYR